MPSHTFGGYVHSLETAGTVDGPGVRFVLFVSGCPLQCQYCHNPDSQFLTQGKRMSVDEVMAEVKGVLPFIKRGGLTISGGEPMMQPAFTHRIFKAAKALGLHTALDTSGYLGMQVSDEYLEAVDLVLLDIKSGDPDTYKTVTGRELQPTIDFARRLSAMGKPMWVRFVLVPGLTDSEDNVQKIANIISPLTNVERIEVLPFHKMGEHKWAANGLDYKLSATQPPSAAVIARTEQILNAAIAAS